jgi:putative SOS response-associated peptidase YedK
MASKDERKGESRMCGRYTITVTLEELILRYMIGVTNVPYHRPKYNVAPGQMVPAVISDGRTNRLGELRWGLIPSWAKDEKIGNRLLNARAETAAEKPAFREPLRLRRCLVPADGFYEWRTEPDGGKQPFRIVLRGGGIFSMAGLYETWTAPDGRRISTVAILTTEPNELMATIHNRMPVILRPEDEALWLDRSVREPEVLRHLYAPYPADELEAYPVDKAVGSVKVDNPDLIRRRAE